MTRAAIKASHKSSRKHLGGTWGALETARGERAAHCDPWRLFPVPVQCQLWELPWIGLPDLTGAPWIPSLDAETTEDVLWRCLSRASQGSAQHSSAHL